MNLKDITRIGALLAAGLGAAASAQAQNVQVRSDNADQARANVEASFKAAARGKKVGLITGRANPQPIVHPDGTVEQELDAGTLSHTVARIGPDGKVSIVCVDSAEAARKAMKAPTFAKRMSLAAKEQSNVK